MNMKDIVTSLEISEKLLTLGVKQKSIFHWIEFEKEKEIYKTVWSARELDNVIASAFTIEEIFQFLPHEFFRFEKVKRFCLVDNVNAEREIEVKFRYHFKMMPVDLGDAEWFCIAIGHGYDNYGILISETSFSEHAMNAADAAAKMLIYLLENGLIKNEN